MRSVPLAGTVRLTGDADSDAFAIARMVESSKENLEHRLVVEAVVGDLLFIAGTSKSPQIQRLSHCAR